MPKFRLLIIFVIASIPLIWSAAPMPPAKAANLAAKKAPTRLSDGDLEKAIKARFAASKISVDKFTAKVQGSVATLEGHTDIIQHKGTATRLAKTAGALAVVNNISISQAAKDKAQANLDSGRRRAQLKRSDTPVPRTQY